jgi:peroxiredoxin
MSVMTEPSPNHPVQPGEPAPGFELPAITRDGVIRLVDFRGNHPVLLGLFRGLHCAFCRRHIAALSALEGELRAKGVETLAVVNTPAERGRAYVRFHPMRLLAASDENRIVHRAYGLPLAEITDSETKWPHQISSADFADLRINPAGVLPGPMDPLSASAYLNKKEGFETTPEDTRTDATGAQLIGAFLVDRAGIVRWTFIEAAEGPSGLGRFPKTEEFLAAAASLAM